MSFKCFDDYSSKTNLDMYPQLFIQVLGTKIFLNFVLMRTEIKNDEKWGESVVLEQILPNTSLCIQSLKSLGGPNPTATCTSKKCLKKNKKTKTRQPRFIETTFINQNDQK